MALKDELLKSLYESKDKFISGQELADTLGVTRSAVWKCMRSLISAGYDIEAVPNAGYRLSVGCDALSAEGIRSFLPLQYRDISISVFDKIDSTNNEAKRIAASGCKCDAVIIAEEQSAGRGRNGHDFYSPRTTGLYFTLLLHPNAALTDATLMTSAAAVAVVDAIKEKTKKEPCIKWVNDILLDGKKICGILTEAVTDFETMSVQAVILGIGINISTSDFPDLPFAGSLGGGCSRNELAAAIAARVFSLCSHLPDRSFMDDYRRYSAVIGREIEYVRNGSASRAVVTGIDDSGGLCVSGADGDLILRSGEISVKLT